MYLDEEEGEEEALLEILYQVQGESSVEVPEEEWSSLIVNVEETNFKRIQYAKGLYKPGSGNICAKYIPLSDSDIIHHPYYMYPSLDDPGIEEALLGEPPKIPPFPYDGQEIYLTLCKEMSLSPIRIFHRSLLTSKIDLRYYGIDPKGFLPIFTALKANTFVEVLDLTGNWMTRDACFHIGEMLVDNSNIRELILSGCRIGAGGSRVLFHHLPSNHMLSKLDVSRNQLEDEGANHLFQALFKDSSVTNINLGNNILTNKAVSSLIEVLEFRNNITHLDLSRNTLLSSLVILKLCQRLSENKNFKQLNLSWNALIGPRIGEAIEFLLKYAKSLQAVILNHNRLGGEAIEYIVKGVSRAKKLDTLDLSYNPLSPKDALMLLERLRLRRVKLKCLLLDDVVVDEEFMEIREEILSQKNRKNTVITHGYVRPRMVYEPQDIRRLLLKRADVICRSGKKKKKRPDFALLVLELYRQDPAPREVKEFSRLLIGLGLRLDGDLIEEMAKAFPGPRAKDKSRTLNLEAVTEYIRRLWPNKKLPPLPPPIIPPTPPPSAIPEKKSLHKQAKKK